MTDTLVHPAAPTAAGFSRRTGLLVLADGTVFEGTGFGAETKGNRRSLLQHRHDGLSGDPDRSVLCGADRRVHLPAYRHRGHQRGGHRVALAGCARACGARRRGEPIELPRTLGPRSLVEEQQHSRDRRHRYARPHQPHPREGHAARDRGACAGWQVRRRRLGESRARISRTRRSRSREGRQLPSALQMARDAVGLERRLWRIAGRPHGARSFSITA